MDKYVKWQFVLFKNPVKPTTFAGLNPDCTVCFCLVNSTNAPSNDILAVKNYYLWQSHMQLLGKHL
ncbi:hypothetical protein [Nitrosopumilus sp. b2]|uniref:hypothetical protein n=1 Tax=Nitrosopumilus sp. b2 TaxID=2109908 RepID=UPI0015F5320D|nr:hypothetical protein [Nitrosopumilus sp. b2]